MISQDEKIRSEALEVAARLDEPAVICRVEGGRVILEGTVSSDEHSYQIEDEIGGIPGVTTVQNFLTVEGFGATIANEVEGVDLTPDFTAEAGTDDSLEAMSEAEPYIPPTDPVVTSSADTADDVEVLNGFAESSRVGAADGTGPLPRGDEDLRSMVEEALRRDASTTDLNVRVFARDGVVTLRGRVQSLDEAEMAESVASSVPGVDEVIEDFQVEGM